MDALDSVTFVPKVKGRPHLVHDLDGRWQGLRTQDLTDAVRALADKMDRASFNYVVGFPEGGVVPAFAFAQAIDRPVILSSRLQLEREPVISFEEPHSPLGTTHYLYGLRPGDSVVIIEDEVTTGRTVINAVRALRASGIRVGQVGVLMAVDDEPMWRRMADEDIALFVGVRVPPGYRGAPTGS